MSLRENYVKFINHLNVDAIIPVMVAEGLLTRKEQDQLQRPGQTDKQRCDFILRSLPSKGKNFYQKFCCCLVWSGQVDLANMIDFDISSVPDMNKYEAYGAQSTHHGHLHPPSNVPTATPPSPPAPSTSPQKLLVLYCKDHQLQSAPELAPHHKRPSDIYCEEVYHLVSTLNMFSNVEMDGQPVQAYQCIYDVLESQSEHISNFIQWYESQLVQCDAILLLCSPSMGSVLRGDSTANILEMEKGLLSSHSLINALPHKKVFPVFLNMPKTLSWLPYSLYSTPCYEVDFKALQEGTMGASEEEFESRAYLLFERDPRLKGFLDLIRALRKERDLDPQPPKNVFKIPDYPIPPECFDVVIPAVTFTYEKLGTKLGLQFHRVNSLRTECNNDFERATRKMFEMWQKEKGLSATPEVLEQALISLNYAAVAEDFRKKINQIKK